MVGSKKPVGQPPIAPVSADGQGGSILLRLLVLWLCGGCLRLTVLAVPPVVPLLHADLHLTEADIGLLSSFPPLLFAAAAVPGALLIARFGTRGTLLIGLILIGTGSAARGVVAATPVLYAATIVMAAGISVMQPAMPQLVRSWFPTRAGFATAVCMNGLLVGEVLSAGLTIPLVLPQVHGSWRLSFAVWSLPVLATLLLVVVCARRLGAGATSRRPAASAWPDWSRPLVWRLGLLLGGVNTMYFVANAFLPDYLTAAGRADRISGALTSLNLCQVPASVLMLGLTGRLVTKRWAYVATGALSLLGIAGILAMRGDWIVLWCGLLGFANAATLILAFALPVLLDEPADVARTSAAMFTISYSCAMGMSVLGGVLWDRTHVPALGMAPVVVSALGVMLLAPSFTGARSDAKASGRCCAPK